MSKTYEIKTSGMFNESFTVEDCAFGRCSWNDEVGYKLQDRAKSVPSSYNYKQNIAWEKVTPLAKLDEDEFKYESQEQYIRGLKVDE